MKKAARMDSSLIARKGQALPTQLSTAEELTEKPALEPAAAPAAIQASPSGAMKSLTVKLDGGRYKALRQLGVDEDRTHQDIMVAALDAYMNTRMKGKTA